jgi:hypothetical protein
MPSMLPHWAKAFAKSDAFIVKMGRVVGKELLRKSRSYYGVLGETMRKFL